MDDRRVRRLRTIGALTVSALFLSGGAGAAGPLRIHDGGSMTVLTPWPLSSEPANSWISQAAYSIASTTGLRLMYVPDGSRAELTPVPDASAKPIVSKDRRRYTFRIRPGLRFSDGTAVRPINFAWAIYRNVFFKSYGGYILRDIVGAKPVADGKTKVLAGVKYTGKNLIIKLAKPSGDLPARLALPMFSALPLKLPSRPPYPSGGPYYVKSDDPNQVVLESNPFYRAARQHHIDTFTIKRSTNEAENIAQILNGSADFLLAGLSEASAEALAPTYGVNGNSQLQIHPSLFVDYVALNTSRGAFADPQMRKAVNYAIDRPAMLRVRGAFGATPLAQVLPPGVPGHKAASVYPTRGPDYAKARQLAGNRCGAVKLYTTTSTTGQALVTEFKYNLSQIGCTVSVESFPSVTALNKAVGTKGEPFDAALVGWNQDYPDPYDFLDILLNGNNIHADGNTNVSYFNNAKVNKLLAQANRLTGPARYKAYGNLDILITTDHAPWAAYDVRNERELVSRRVSEYAFNRTYASADLAEFALK